MSAPESPRGAADTKPFAVANVRCEPRVMDHLRAAAKRNFRTVNMEIVSRLVQSVEQERRTEEVPD